MIEYVNHIVVLICVFGTLSISLDILVGRTGLLSVAQAAFFGVGAYTAALLTVRAGSGFIAATALGVCVAVVVSFLISLPSLRLRDDYFAIATFGFQMIAFSLFNNWTSVTQGALGISNIPPPQILGWRVSSSRGFVVLAAILVGLSQLFVWRLAKSPFGRVLLAIRGDEMFAQAVGKNTIRFKVTAFAVSAGLAAISGSVYAHYMTYIDPTSFTVMDSILVISMVVIGGACSSWGPLVGAGVLVSLPEVLRFIGFPSATAANLRQIVYGLLLVLVVAFRPRGVAGSREAVQ